MLEIGEELDFDYLETRIHERKEYLNHKYNIIGVICQKKGPEKYYPAIKESENIFDMKFRGYINGQEKVALISQFDREFIHYIVYERRDVQF